MCTLRRTICRQKRIPVFKHKCMWITKITSSRDYLKPSELKLLACASLSTCQRIRSMLQSLNGWKSKLTSSEQSSKSNKDWFSWRSRSKISKMHKHLLSSSNSSSSSSSNSKVSSSSSNTTSPLLTTIKLLLTCFRSSLCKITLAMILSRFQMRLTRKASSTQTWGLLTWKLKSSVKTGTLPSKLVRVTQRTNQTSFLL